MQVVFLQASVQTFQLVLLSGLLLTSVYTFYLQVENMGRVNYGPYIFDRKVSIVLPLASHSIFIDH